MNDEATAELAAETFKKSNWKHMSSHPMGNLVSPLDSRMHTKSQTRNHMDFLTLISTIEPKNIKEALKDVDWVNSMWEELHQF